MFVQHNDETHHTIETERLRLEPFSEAHITDRYVAWLNDPEVVRYSEQRHQRHDRDSCALYLASFEGTPHEFRAIVAKDPSLGHIGNLNAYVHPNWQVADVGILLGEPSIWGRGYGTEAWAAFCDHLIKARGMRKITAGTLSVNTGMLGIMAKTRMVDDGRRTRQAIWNGQEVDLIHTALFDSPLDRSK